MINHHAVILDEKKLQPWQPKPRWINRPVEQMTTALKVWCELAEQSGLLYLKKFAKYLRRHCIGICNYAKYRLTSVRIEAGNISIGMIRKRARGIRDTEYFKVPYRGSVNPTPLGGQGKELALYSENGAL